MSLALVKPDGEHVTGCGVQHGVFRKIEEDRQAVPFPAAEHDEIARLLPRHAQDLRLETAGFDEAFAVSEAGACGEFLQPLARAPDELLLDLHGRQQRFAHRLDRNVLDDVQELDAGTVCGSDGPGALAEDFALLREVDDQENLAISGHDGCSRRGPDYTGPPRPAAAGASARAISANCAG